MDAIATMGLHSKVWVYQANRFFSEEEIATIKIQGASFINQWAAHGASLKASFDVLHKLFLVIAVDEEQALASGCSIDSSVKFMKELELKFNVNLFDRMQVAYRLGDTIKICSLSVFEKMAELKQVDENTIVFNNIITTKKEFDENWEVPLKNSWQKRVLAV